MKKVTQKLLDYLHTRDSFYMCDLYEIRLFNGQTFRYADYGIDITMDDGRVFNSKSPIFTRESIKLSSEIEVDKMNITIHVDESDQISGQPIMQIAHNGGFDEATLTLYRCFMDTPGVVVGTVELFSGDIDVKSGGGLELALEVKSSVQRLNINYPIRKYYPNCPWQVYGEGCGVDVTPFIKTGTVTQVISAQEFHSNLSFADEYYDQGVIKWNSGALDGVIASVKRSYRANGRIVVLVPPEAAPVVGDKFTIYPGCDKTPETCRDKFNNFLRNRATPYIPLKETIM